MPKPTSSVTDEQILACIASQEAEGGKVTIGSVSEALHVRRNRVQPLLARRRAEREAERELQARTGPTVAELRAEVEWLKQKLAERDAEPADMRKLRQENREMRKELKELRAVRKALSLYYYDAPRVEQERFRAGLGAIIKDLREKGANLLDED